jgi:hypothetical protein
VGAGEFKIAEYPPGAVEGEGEIFVWTVDKSKPGGTQSVTGGARAAPVAPWEQEKEQRRVRTDYPGARLPSLQVLGSVEKPFTWNGLWDDRYNFRGYALAEQKRFGEMVDRGNPVRVSFKSQVFWGVVASVKFLYHRDSKIGYSFSLDVTSRDGGEKRDRSPDTAEQPERALGDVDILAAATARAHANKPAWATKGTLVSDVSAALAKVSTRINDVAKALDTRTGVLKPIGDAKNLALQFRALQGDCTAVVLRLVAAKSDVSMGVRTAKAALDFDDWVKNTATLMRLTMGRSKLAADALDRRDIPAAKALYRPFKGEHLYSVSRKAYGTWTAWREIQKANHLSTLVMAGTETLVIPDRGAV